MVNVNTVVSSLLPLAPAVRLPPDLLDGITEAVLTPRDAGARGQAICAIVREIYASVAWLDADLEDGELASLRSIIDEATAHHARLTVRCAAPSTAGVEAS